MDEGQETPKEFFKRHNMRGMSQPRCFFELAVGGEYRDGQFNYALCKKTGPRSCKAPFTATQTVEFNDRDPDSIAYPPAWTPEQCKKWRFGPGSGWRMASTSHEGVPAVRMVSRLLCDGETPKEFFKRHNMRGAAGTVTAPKLFRVLPVGAKFNNSNGCEYEKFDAGTAYGGDPRRELKARVFMHNELCFPVKWGYGMVQDWLRQHNHNSWGIVEEGEVPFDELNFPTDSSRLGLVKRNKRSKVPLAAPEAVPLIV